MVSTNVAAGQQVIVRAASPEEARRLRALVEAGKGEIVVDLPLIDGFAATVTPQALASLRAVDDSITVVPDSTVTLTEPEMPERGDWNLQVATATLKLPQIWDKGFKGKGIGIAVIDTGVAPHPDFGSRIVGFHDRINWRTDPYDDRGHGTHVAGIAAGDGSASGGKYCGAAPEANIIGIKVMDQNGKGQLSDIIAGLQWAVENKQTYNIRVINMSLGAKPEVPLKRDPLVAAVEKANEAGILVVAAAGNKGPYPNTIDTPATSPAALTVGATIDYRTPDLGDDKVAWYSGTGPTSFDRLVKPDVIAPGTYIVSTWTDGGYKKDTGTSMAAPLVAGAAALLIDARPETTPEELRQVLRETSQKIRSYDENIQGKGVVRPLASLESLMPQPEPVAH